MIFNFMAKNKKIRSCSTNTTLLWTQCKKNRNKKIFVENLHAAYCKWPLIRCTKLGGGEMEFRIKNANIFLIRFFLGSPRDTKR